MAKKYKIPTIKKLIDAGVHFGHQVKRWHPDMEQYIYTVKRNIHIIDLEVTEKLLQEAVDFLYETAKKGGKIVFVGTKKQAREIIEIEAKRSGAMYVTERWLGGTITNFEVIKKNNIDKMLDLKSKMEKGEFEKYTKKERLLIDREIERLERFVGGLANMNTIPDALIVVDSRREHTAVREAIRANVPIVALIDTNSDPKGIDYRVPGNDDAIKSIACIIKTLSDAIEVGYEDYAKGIKEEKELAVEEKKAEEKKEDKKVGEAKKKKSAKKTTKKTTTKKAVKKPKKKPKEKKKRGRPKKS